MKKCIVYIPYKLEANGNGARMIRPKKMIRAFEKIGYDVFVIQGYSKERKKNIKELKKRVRKGEKYDFMYTESHTEPTLLTDPHHLPTHPFMDFSFFNYVKRKGINIGLFYCDYYWKFDNYGINLPKWKKIGAIINYKYDLYQYKKYLSKFYLPNLNMCNVLDEERLTYIASELPPGSDIVVTTEKKYTNRDFNENPLRIFYVGGLGGHYELIELVKAVHDTNFCELTICCREPEWDKEKEKYDPYLCDRIKIVHKNSDELQALYNESDIFSLVFKNSFYMDSAKPVKAYEAIAYELPMISTTGTAMSDIIANSNIGWTVTYDANEISLLLTQLVNNPCDIQEKKNALHIVKEKNYWEKRAKKVAEDLMHK